MNIKSERLQTQNNLFKEEIYNSVAISERNNFYQQSDAQDHNLNSLKEILQNNQDLINQYAQNNNDQNNQLYNHRYNEQKENRHEEENDSNFVNNQHESLYQNLEKKLKEQQFQLEQQAQQQENFLKTQNQFKENLHQNDINNNEQNKIKVFNEGKQNQSFFQNSQIPFSLQDKYSPKNRSIEKEIQIILNSKINSQRQSPLQQKEQSQIAAFNKKKVKMLLQKAIQFQKRYTPCLINQNKRIKFLAFQQHLKQQNSNKVKNYNIQDSKIRALSCNTQNSQERNQQLQDFINHSVSYQQNDFLQELMITENMNLQNVIKTKENINNQANLDKSKIFLSSIYKNRDHELSFYNQNPEIDIDQFLSFTEAAFIQQFERAETFRIQEHQNNQKGRLDLMKNQQQQIQNNKINLNIINSSLSKKRKYCFSQQNSKKNSFSKTKIQDDLEEEEDLFLNGHRSNLINENRCQDIFHKTDSFLKCQSPELKKLNHYYDEKYEKLFKTSNKLDDLNLKKNRYNSYIQNLKIKKSAQNKQTNNLLQDFETYYHQIPSEFKNIQINKFKQNNNKYNNVQKQFQNYDEKHTIGPWQTAITLETPEIRRYKKNQ